MAAALGTKRRVARRGPDARAAQLAAAEKAIETANKKTNEEFTSEYIQPDGESWPIWTHPKTKEEYNLSVRSPGDMPEAELEACYELIDQTSGDDYRSLSVGWHPEAKRKEMRSPGLRYVLVKRKKGNDKNDTEEEKTENGGEGEIRAFTSLMPTFEDGQPVIYCYEIHLKPDMERTGLGKLLMGHVTAAADRIPTLEKTMLTCFVRNAHARGFYERLGFAEDESSPRPRRLRGKVVEPEYIIMARRTDKERGGQVADGEQESKRAKTAP